MDANIIDKPLFGRDQIVSATTATKKFSDVRKRAKKAPQFIFEHNQVDSVLIDYCEYEEMYGELFHLRELIFYDIAAERIREGDAVASRKGKSLEEVMNADEYEAFRKSDPDIISDEDLFE